MNDPALIGGVAMLLAAFFIGFKLVAPDLKKKGQNSSPARAFTNAKARMVTSD